jgi:phage baseplate assembly protein W
MVTLRFENFGRTESGRVVTDAGGMAVVQARNPYGSHNLVLVDEFTSEAIRHGTMAVVEAVASWLPQKQYRRVRKYLAARGIGVDWYVSGTQ